MTPVSVRRVDAFRREVVQFLKVGIHDDFLFIGVFEGFGSTNHTFTLCDDFGTATQASHISTEDYRMKKC
jgi:hypothetical protein